ncbi:MAG: D-tyrosyl-tRNA(Tyr) deacylase [Acholeplasmataceae bacterium]|nr:MAG: D-tyrosyl-tRNA(Tyr) deacylase [Acholeplasmataceae bacterium]
MRVLVQRVSTAEVTVESARVARIGKGYLLYVGIHHDDDDATIVKMAEKITNLRVFEDDQGKMNLNLKAIDGAILAVSQFTLYGDTKGNNRPSFTQAASPDKAEALYDAFISQLRMRHHVESGVFAARMAVQAVNDGPVTIWIEM